MASVRSKDTKAELALRKAIWARGLRFRKHCKDLPGTPDVVLPSSKIAIFIDGDFWHGNFKSRGFASLEQQFEGVNNSEWWLDKIRKNIDRDKRINKELKKLGYKVIRIWESNLIKNLDKYVKKIETLHVERKLNRGNGSKSVRKGARAVKGISFERKR
jgi:DNA mismatch endonuclease (patch repair protein)